MRKKTEHHSLYTIASPILKLIAKNIEIIGRYIGLGEQSLPPRLRRKSRIRTIQAWPTIENNTLTLEQVTATLNAPD